MVPLKSNYVTQSIPYKKVAQVVVGAQEKVLFDEAEPPQQLGPCDRIVDKLLCSGVKTTAISQLRSMSHHTAYLHLELQRPPQYRNPTLIKTHAQKIGENQKKLSVLMCGDTLEFGSTDGRAVIGKDSFLVHRSPSRSCPTGIPLYGSGKFIPRFKTVTDISTKDIQPIRTSGDRNDGGVIICDGIRYKLHFDRDSRPSVVTNHPDQQCQLLQFRLVTLWEINPQHFALSPSIQTTLPVPTTAPVPATGSTGSTGSTESIAPAPGTIALMSGGASGSQRSPQTMPTFEKAKAIGVEHFEQIRIMGQLSCGGKVYQVRFLNHDEPTILCLGFDPDLKSVQIQLLVIWVAAQSRRALERLDLLISDATLTLPSPFPDTESEQFKIRARLKLDEAWDEAARAQKKDFAQLVPLLRDLVPAEKLILSKKFKKLINNKVDVEEQRNTFLGAESILSDLTVYHKKLNENIESYKDMYRKLFELAKKCTSEEMQKIVLGRIKAFNTLLNNFAQNRLSPVQAKQLNYEMQNNLIFIEEFDSSQAQISGSLVGPSEVNLSGGVTAIPPKSPDLITLVKELTDLLSSSKYAWQEIQGAIHKVQLEQDRVISVFIHKQNNGIRLENRIKTFKGENGEGLDPETNLSFYTPETYSRIVTLKQMRSQFQSRVKYLSESALIEKIREVNEHIRQIQIETALIDGYAKRDGFVAHRMYMPELNIGNRKPMNYSQWSDDMKSRERG